MGRTLWLVTSQCARVALPVMAVIHWSCGEAVAHITMRSPYVPGVDEGNWAAVSNAIFVLGQLLGWAYLAAILQAERRGRSVWINLGLAGFVQTGVAVVLVLSGAITFFLAAEFTHDVHLIPSGYEILSVVRRDLVFPLLLADVVTFALGWGASILLLLIVRGMRRRWRVALVHALVCHPFAFPVGILAGLMHVLYVRRLLPR